MRKCLLPFFAFAAIASVFGEEAFKGGLWKKFEFDKPDLTPIVFGGESRSENVTGQKYCIYLDMWHDDGTPVWGYKCNWTPGTHDWESITGAYVPQKPLKKVWMYIFPEPGKGKAEFRKLWLERREGRGDCLSSHTKTRLPFELKDRTYLEVFEGKERVKKTVDSPRLPTDIKTGAVSSDDYAVWLADSMRSVTPLTFPTKEEIAADKCISVDVAIRERESFQVAITCGGN